MTVDLHNQNDGFTITGSAPADTLTGGLGNDTLNAGVGNDTINGFQGQDTVDGGAGTDTIVLTATSTDLNAATNARITNVEAVSAAGATAGVTIDLHNQNDGFTITGSASADTLTGSLGNDTLNGRAGSDTLMGEAGNDTLTGGNGNDTFVFRAGFGNDTITDFQVGTAANHDTLDLRGLGFTSVADLLSHTDAGANALIHAGTETVTLQGVTKAQLQSHAFDLLIA
jgi:Ca2+-binding RTX toxin-like protein